MFIETSPQGDRPTFLRLRRWEAAALAAAAVLVFAHLGASWGLFALLVLLPDIALVGYIAGPRVGALCYNLLHTYLLPVAIGAVGFALDFQPLMVLGTVWVAHIAVDRALGFGLKYTGGFKQTHLTTIGAT